MPGKVVVAGAGGTDGPLDCTRSGSTRPQGRARQTEIGSPSSRRLWRSRMADPYRVHAPELTIASGDAPPQKPIWSRTGPPRRTYATSRSSPWPFPSCSGVTKRPQRRWRRHVTWTSVSSIESGSPSRTARTDTTASSTLSGPIATGPARTSSGSSTASMPRALWIGPRALPTRWTFRSPSEAWEPAGCSGSGRQPGWRA